MASERAKAGKAKTDKGECVRALDMIFDVPAMCGCLFSLFRVRADVFGYQYKLPRWPTVRPLLDVLSRAPPDEFAPSLEEQRPHDPVPWWQGSRCVRARLPSSSLTRFAGDKKRKAASPLDYAVQKKRRSVDGSLENGAGGDQVDLGFDYGDFGGGDIEVRESFVDSGRRALLTFARRQLSTAWIWEAWTTMPGSGRT